MLKNWCVGDSLTCQRTVPDSRCGFLTLESGYQAGGMRVRIWYRRSARGVYVLPLLLGKPGRRHSPAWPTANPARRRAGMPGYTTSHHTTEVSV